MGRGRGGDGEQTWAHPGGFLEEAREEVQEQHNWNLSLTHEQSHQAQWRSWMEALPSRWAPPAGLSLPGLGAGHLPGPFRPAQQGTRACPAGGMAGRPGEVPARL